jgi:ribonuclease J
LRIIPLGGCGEFGMNLTAFLAAGKLFVVDCGVRFPDPARLGVDAVLPAVSPHFAVAGGPYAYILTHGHEDHLGAMPYVLPRWPAPVYGSAWTMALLKSKLTRLGYDPDGFKLITVQDGDRVATTGFEAEYVHVNHSIPQASMLVIRTGGLTLFHTGDFKFEEKPLVEKPTDFARLKALGDAGIDVLLADSTNAEKSGNCPPESACLEPLRAVIAACPKAALITTFSSNLWRLKTIADACAAAKRRIYIAGAGLESTLTHGESLGLYTLPKGLRVAEDELNGFPRSKLVVLATGCQGEYRSALARIANGEHKMVRAEPGDTIILSSRIIPGNEKPILNMLNAFMKLGCHVVTTKEAPGIHVSGHAYGGDLERLVQTLRPRRFLPVHGAFSQLRANLDRAATDGRLVETGDALDLTRDGITEVGKVEVELEFVDADAGVLISYETLRERLRVGELGAALVTGVFAPAKMDWVVPPTIDLTGLKVPDGWQKDTARAVQTEVKVLAQKRLPLPELCEEVRVLVRRQLFAALKKKPVVTVRLHFI